MSTFNSISIKYCLPVGIHDLNTMDVDFCVRTSNEKDVFLPFGAKDTESVNIKELAELLKKHFNVNVNVGLINSENKEYETK